ncbi:MAG: hypothetical protein BalsKO_30320 [Balneolaceae bacterium]
MTLMLDLIILSENKAIVMNRNIRSICLLVIIIVVPIKTRAQIQGADSTYELKGDIAINGEVLSEENLRTLCLTARKEFLRATSEYNIFKRVLEIRVEIPASDPEYKEKMTAFWRVNMSSFICPEYTLRGQTYPRQHIFKRLMHEKFPDAFYDLFWADDLVEIDFNFVEQTVRGSETLVDYLDFLLLEKSVYYSSNDLDVIEDVRNGLLDEFGAKRAKDL